MRRRVRFAGGMRGLLLAALLFGAGAAPSFAADATPPAGVAIAAPGKPEHVVTGADLAMLPASQVTLSFETEHGARQGSFEGPLLWAVLTHEGAVDPAQPRGQVRQYVLVEGSDGYTAVLALGELSPAFEGKTVVLAVRADGQDLAPGHLRLAVPGDKRGGRSVRDVVRIAVLPAAGGQP